MTRMIPTKEAQKVRSDAIHHGNSLKDSRRHTHTQAVNFDNNKTLLHKFKWSLFFRGVWTLPLMEMEIGLALLLRFLRREKSNWPRA